MLERGIGIVAVELAFAGKDDRSRADTGRTAQGERSANSPGEISVTILVAAGRAEAVDSGRALPADCARAAGIAAGERGRRARSRKAERSTFGRRGISRRVIEAVDSDYAADRIRTPDGRLRTSNHFDPRGEIGVEQLEAGRISGRGIVDLDPVDEEQAVIGFRPADSHFGERARRSDAGNGGRGRQSKQVGDERLAETLKFATVDDGDACRRLRLAFRSARSGDDDLRIVDWQCGHGVLR